MKEKIKSQPHPRPLSEMIKAAHAAGKILQKYFRKKISIREKRGAGLVTEADLQAENTIVKILKKTHPDFGFLTEEAPPEISQSSGRWLIDPLDGTTNFVHGFPMFCVSIALEWKNLIVAGVIYHPLLDETYTAVRGQGAFVNHKKIQVSQTTQLKKSLLTTGFTYRKTQWLHTEMEAFERLSGIARAIRRPGSAALDLAYTARGVFDGFWERRLSPWDIAAGSLLVEEAGGKVTDFQGKPFQTHTSEILASNAGLHKELLKTIAPESCPLYN